MKRFSYRKVTPTMVELMQQRQIKLQTTNAPKYRIYKLIATEFEVSVNTVLYWLDTEYRERSLIKKREQAKNYYRNLSTTKKRAHIEYIKDYHKRRYHNDEEFRRRMITYVQKSHRKRMATPNV